MYRAMWARDKRNIAAQLARGQAGGGYAEAVILLCSAISGLSADVWPAASGHGRDRRRFVEALACLVPEALKTTWVSVPLLIGRLGKQSGFDDDSDQLSRLIDRFDMSRVVTSCDIDRSDTEICQLCPSCPIKVIRECSYANLLYTELRSSYAHEYRTSEKAAEHPMTATITEPVSYVNAVWVPHRQIHFHWQWIGEVAIALAERIDALNDELPRSAPPNWWLAASVG
jgi:hypothetical protein